MYDKLSYLLSLVCLFPVTGCITISDTQSESLNGAANIHFGLILVDKSKNSVAAQVNKFRVLGAWTDTKGVGVGYTEKTKVIPNPDCQVIFIVRNKSQFDRSVELLETTQSENGGEICISEI